MSKTYGQILTEESCKRINERMTTLGYDESQEEVARAVILEFVKRVEEESLLQSYSDIQADGDADCWHLSAFRKLAAELKEAK